MILILNFLVGKNNHLIPSENGDAILVADLHGHQERHGLDRVVPAVDVVSHEEVVGVW